MTGRQRQYPRQSLKAASNTMAQNREKAGCDSEEVKGLLQTVGGTAEPILHAIKRLQPSVVVLVCSEDTQKTVVSIKEMLSQGQPGQPVPQVKTLLIDNPANLIDCHTIVRHGLTLLRETYGLSRESIRIDFTGGTKAMSAAAVLAAAPEGYRFCYVSGEQRDKGGVGAVVSGTEQLCLPENPWTVLEEPELMRLLDMVDLGQWAAALDTTGRLLTRATPDSGPLFQHLQRVVEGLAFWDRFEHDRAWKAWDEGETPRQLAKLATVGRRPQIASLAEKCQRMVGQLKMVANCKDDSEAIKKSDPLVFDMLANGDRQASRGSFDEASLRYYRALELCADRRLQFCHAIDNSATKDSDVPQPLRDEFLSRKGPAVQPWKLGQYESVQLLDALNDPLGKRLFEAMRANRLDNQARNENWLIHGTQHVDEKRFQAFRKNVLDALGLDESRIPRWPAFRMG